VFVICYLLFSFLNDYILLKIILMMNLCQKSAHKINKVYLSICKAKTARKCMNQNTMNITESPYLYSRSIIYRKK